ncbi:hypothetical protein LSUB1_G002439 [Lachnellula subtilissima]|uniref:Uncharacterized protein n=1 Tax=Lachnellula subtilissima TaxID=602034 RepID=A0A8H8RTQ8_9HELO|nr:hypothetical protein LSUB1_G002439 [Lachnellula subtilissima]
MVAGYVGVSWAIATGDQHTLETSRNPNYIPQDQWPELDGQKTAVGVIPAELAVGNGQKTLELEDATDAMVAGVQQLLVTTTMYEAAVTVTYPKITEGPTLLKRKLGSNRWDLIHEGIQGQKRDATDCPADYKLCPKSMNGGCCPNDRVCGTSSCLPTSAGPSSACGKVGYTACDISDGGGCCPGGYVCGQAGCSPSAGVSNTQTCGINSYLCPASLGYGCCKNGLGCALEGCWTTSATTWSTTETLTTTDASSHSVTITTAIVTAVTPSAPAGSVVVESNLIPKVTSTPTGIAKTDATGTSSSNGLSKAAIGGIIGGAVAFLVIILIVAFLILRRLNTAIKAASDGSRTRASSSVPRSAPSRPRNPRETPDIDAMSVDPLMMTGSEAGSVRHASYPSQSTIHEFEASPPMFSSPFSPNPPPHTHYPRGYHAVAPSESAHSNVSSNNRNPSVESTPPMVQTNRDYFSVPLRSERNSQGSQGRRPSAHGRNWSNASEGSEVSAVSSGAIELEGEQPSRKSSIHSAWQRFGIGRLGSKKTSTTSNAPVLTGGPTSNKQNWNSPMSPGLGHIPEAGESRHQVNTGALHVGMEGLSGTQLREAGLSNSQLREMTMSEQGPHLKETS